MRSSMSSGAWLERARVTRSCFEAGYVVRFRCFCRFIGDTPCPPLPLLDVSPCLSCCATDVLSLQADASHLSRALPQTIRMLAWQRRALVGARANIARPSRARCAPDTACRKKRAALAPRRLRFAAGGESEDRWTIA